MRRVGDIKTDDEWRLDRLAMGNVRFPLTWP